MASPDRSGQGRTIRGTAGNFPVVRQNGPGDPLVNTRIEVKLNLTRRNGHPARIRGRRSAKGDKISDAVAPQSAVGQSRRRHAQHFFHPIQIRVDYSPAPGLRKTRIAGDRFVQRKHARRHPLQQISGGRLPYQSFSAPSSPTAKPISRHVISSPR